MLTWEITGPNLPALRIRARSFDEALEKARIRDRNYCGGQVVEDDADGWVDKCMRCVHCYQVQSDADELRCRCRKGCNFKEMEARNEDHIL